MLYNTICLAIFTLYAAIAGVSVSASPVGGDPYLCMVGDTNCDFVGREVQ